MGQICWSFMLQMIKVICDDARIVLYVDDDNVYETFSNESGYANIQLNELIFEC